MSSWPRIGPGRRRAGGGGARPPRGGGAASAIGRINSDLYTNSVATIARTPARTNARGRRTTADQRRFILGSSAPGVGARACQRRRARPAGRGSGHQNAEVARGGAPAQWPLGRRARGRRARAAFFVDARGLFFLARFFFWRGAPLGCYPFAFEL